MVKQKQNKGAWKRPPKPSRTVTCLAMFLCLACIVGTSTRVTAQDKPDIDITRATLENWVETKRLISKEKRDLELSRQVLNENIELIRREIETMRGKIKDAEASIAEADKKRTDLLEQKDKLKQASSSLNMILVSLEVSTVRLLSRLPEPICERVKPLSQRIPENPAETNLSTAQRFQNVVGILNEVNKFNREITVTSEVRTLPDGTTAEVTALYLGIGQAYYTGSNGTIGGIGTSSDEGWVWKPANESAAEIAKVVAIMKNEQVASFVHVPIEVK